ncbi:MAG: electron transfer flavoprotein subunit alpha/FixB family protein [Candidatus Bipolaricaulota bacterium]
MNAVTVIAEYSGEEIHPVTYELLGKGRELAEKLEGKLSAALLAPPASSPEELFRRGVDTVYQVKNQALAEPIETIYKRAFLQVVEQAKPEIILIGATNFGRSLAPRVAMALDTSLTADCTGLDIDDQRNFIQIRPAFSGNILAHIKSRTSPQIATVRYREFAEAQPKDSASGETIEVQFEISEKHIPKVRILEAQKGTRVRLEDAEVVVAGGRGLESPEDFQLLEKLAGVLGGHVAASRPVVDEGWIGRDHQVGYSGRRVKPKLYFACGISGQSQHLAGMKSSETIIAINSDPSAPIFEYADYGIVGDLYEVIPELIKQLEEE